MSKPKILTNNYRMPMQPKNSKKTGFQEKLAILIDADNAHASIIEPLLAEIAKYGVASIKRVYGDWTTPHLGGWKDVLPEHSIQPVQQFRYTVGKNATASAMIIDAMDLLHTARLDGFCLVSSDSDFTRLASRIREEGKRVYGFGEKKTPRPFVVACDKFIYSEILMVDEDPPVEVDVKSTDIKSIDSKGTKVLRGDTHLVNLIRTAIDAFSDDEGWAHLGQLGHHIVNQAPDCDSRNYGFKKLSELVKAVGLFEVHKKSKGIFVRDRRKPA